MTYKTKIKKATNISFNLSSVLHHACLLHESNDVISAERFKNGKYLFPSFLFLFPFLLSSLPLLSFPSFFPSSFPYFLPPFLSSLCWGSFAYVHIGRMCTAFRCSVCVYVYVLFYVFVYYILFSSIFVFD